MQWEIGLAKLVLWGFRLYHQIRTQVDKIFGIRRNVLIPTATHEDDFDIRFEQYTLLPRDAHLYYPLISQTNTSYVNMMLHLGCPSQIHTTSGNHKTANVLGDFAILFDNNETNK